MFFNMLFFFQHAVFLIQHAVFFLHDFQHARFCRSIFQHAISLFEHAFFSCSNFNMLYSSPPFQHGIFITNFNMLDSAGPFFSMLFHSLNMLFFPAAITTCYIHHHHFNMLYSSTPFQHAIFITTIHLNNIAC